MAFLSWITPFLLISVTPAELNRIPENYVLAKKYENSVALTCRTSTTGPVTWKLNNQHLNVEDHYTQIGHKLIVMEVEGPLLGEYSCWSGKKKLSSTYLLQEIEEDEEDIDSLLTCRAKSYDCNFSCKFTEETYAKVHLGIGPECSKGQSTCNWVSRHTRPDNESLEFRLSHTLSPFAEESTMLEVTVEAINIHKFSLLRRTKVFYLREIVIPDSPKFRTEVVGNKLNVSIYPPASWSTPHSFFSLEHELEYVLRDDGAVNTTMSTLIPVKISRLRVRSRDPLVLSPWSQWTPWKNVRNSCQCKKKQRPHLTLHCKEHCMRKMERRKLKEANQSQLLLKIRCI